MTPNKTRNHGFEPGRGAKGSAARDARKKIFAPASTPDPANSDRQYTEEETEILKAVADYRVETGRRFPTACEVLTVMKRLGYRRVVEA